MRRGSIVVLVGIAVVAAGVATAVAVVPTWLPVEASREAGRTDFALWFLIGICIAIFSIVAAVLVYSVIRFRVREDDFEDGPPIHGHTGLEITWTAIPLALVTAVAIVSAIVLSRNDAHATDTLRVNVTAQQFTFTFGYPDANNATSPVLRLPVDRSVELDMRSLDVIHSVFVPSFAVKEDVVPGMVTHLHVTPDRLGTFPLECTELCGLGHSLMRTEAVVMTQAAFDKWIAKQKQGAAGSTASSSSSASGSTSGLAVFKANNCASCHTLSAAGATAKVGPDLDRLASYAQQAHAQLASFVHESIVDPNAYIQPGYPKSLMPQTFGTSLTKPQLDALVQFLVQSSQKASTKG